MKLEFEPKLIQVNCVIDGAPITLRQEFGYILQDSIIPVNVFSAKFTEIDQLDTHDPFFN